MNTDYNMDTIAEAVQKTVQTVTLIYFIEKGSDNMKFWYIVNRVLTDTILY